MQEQCFVGKTYLPTVENTKAVFRMTSPFSRSDHPLLLHLICCVTETRCVAKQHWVSSNIQVGLYDVSRCPCNIRHNGSWPLT